MRNPLLEKFTEPFGTIPFNEIETEHFVPALDVAIDEAKSEVDAVINNPDAPTFKNTVLAMELVGKKLGRVATTYFHLFGSESDKDFQALAGEISPKLAKFSNDINLNEDVFKRVEEVYENQMDSLNEEDARLTELSYKGFVRNGANLSVEDKEEIRLLDQEMSTLSPQFSNNNLNATNSYEMWLDEEDLDGLPDIIKEGAKMAAKSKGKDDKWLVTLQFPSYFPFMKFSNRRDLREELMRASVTKCNGGEFDNTKLCKRIAKLKHERAMLLGYDNFADYILEKRMAENQSNIFNLLDNLYDACYEPAKNDLGEIRAIAKEMDGIDDIEPWDTVYYAEKLK